MQNSDPQQKYPDLKFPFEFRDLTPNLKISRVRNSDRNVGFRIAYLQDAPETNSFVEGSQLKMNPKV